MHDLPRDPRRLLHVVALLVAPLGFALVFAGLASIVLGRTALTCWGWLWSLEALLLGAALLAPLPHEGVAVTRWRVVRAASVVVLAVLVLVRIARYGGDADTALVVLDEHGQVQGGARWLDRLFEERDATIVGGRALVASGLLTAAEFPSLPGILRSSYEATEADAPRLGTPIVATLLGQQRPQAFDAIVASPRGAPSGLGVVFLHGSAGSFVLPCLEVVRAARRRGAHTICPATDIEGAWWRADDEVIVRASIRHLRALGARRVVLVGLSNGGIGASRLAPRLRGELEGLVLISGVSRDAPSPAVPTLLLQGSDDSMVPTAAVRDWASRHPRVHYLELPGTHFVLLERREEVARALDAAFAAHAPSAADTPAVHGRAR